MYNKRNFLSMFAEYNKSKLLGYSFEWKHVNTPLDIDPSSFLFQGKVSKEINGVRYKYDCILTTKMIILRKLSNSGKSFIESLKSTYEFLCLKLSNPRLEIINTDIGSKIKLTSKNHTETLYIKENTDRFLKNLKKISILENINNNYIIKNIISSGGSGIVRVGYKLKTSEEFAIKSIPKTNFTEKNHSFVFFFKYN